MIELRQHICNVPGASILELLPSHNVKDSELNPLLWPKETPENETQSTVKAQLSSSRQRERESGGIVEIMIQVWTMDLDSDTLFIMVFVGFRGWDRVIGWTSIAKICG